MFLYFPYVLTAWVAGVLLSFALPVVPPPAVWAAVLCAAGLLCAFRRAAGVMLLAAVLAAGYGVWRTQSALAAQWPSERGRAVLRFEVADLPQVEGRAAVFSARGTTEDGRVLRVRLSDYARRDWPAGSRWSAEVRLKPPVGEVNLRGFDREAWALANGVDASGTVGKARTALPDGGMWQGGMLRLRFAISRRWQDTPPEAADGAALMRALSIGEQNALPDRMWQVFRPLGLNHLVSISGLHVSMVAVLAAWLAKCVLGRLPFTMRRPRTAVLSAGMAAALFYAAMAGFSVPTLRSLLMLGVVAAGWLSGGTASAWRGWWLAAALVLLLDPAAALAAGSWLSFGLVAALLWAGSWRGGSFRQSALMAQWAATLMSVVAVGWFFGAVPLLSPLANAVAIPWFSWVLTPLALAASVLPFYPLQWLAVWLAEYSLRALVWLAQYAPEWGVAAVPWPLAVSAVAAAGVLLLPRGLALRVPAVLVLAGFVFYRPPQVAPGRLKAVVLDVGQGLSVYFQTASKSLLFDTGTAGAAQMQTLPSLRAAGVRRLDMLLLSHHDDDHDGGAEAVRQVFRPREILAGQPSFYPGAQSCRHARAWHWDGVGFELLAAGEEGDAADNDQSCVLRVLAGGEAFLVTGDLGAKGEGRLIDDYGDTLYSQVLVLGHHGSKTASSGKFLNAVRPDYAVASSGFNNTYGHPAQDVRDRLSARGITLLRTDRQGALVFELGGGEVSVRPWRAYRPYWRRKPFAD
ncbi:MAG: DNA internalization-related competence protein ComEC/Rec2 [Neisseria sp.]|nr:DNA internalization-related competence protein ComEC/Rec2 [Neisseria sp.]